jgi:hypothetical protein
MDKAARFLRRHRTSLIVVACIGALVTVIMAAGTPNGVPFNELEPGVVVELEDNGVVEAARVKVVKVEPAGVHIVLLDQGEVGRLPGGEAVTMDGMHLPIGRRMWDDMESRRVGSAKVTPEELEGYRTWQREGGGYFDE